MWFTCLNYLLNNIIHFEENVKENTFLPLGTADINNFSSSNEEPDYTLIFI